jgi:hypothetical protein
MNTFCAPLGEKKYTKKMKGTNIGASHAAQD